MSGVYIDVDFTWFIGTIKHETDKAVLVEIDEIDGVDNIGLEQWFPLSWIRHRVQLNNTDYLFQLHFWLNDKNEIQQLANQCIDEGEISGILSFSPKVLRGSILSKGDKSYHVVITSVDEYELPGVEEHLSHKFVDVADDGQTFNIRNWAKDILEREYSNKWVSTYHRWDRENYPRDELVEPINIDTDNKPPEITENDLIAIVSDQLESTVDNTADIKTEYEESEAEEFEFTTPMIKSISNKLQQKYNVKVEYSQLYGNRTLTVSVAGRSFDIKFTKATENYFYIHGYNSSWNTKLGIDSIEQLRDAIISCLQESSSITVSAARMELKSYFTID